MPKSKLRSKSIALGAMLGLAVPAAAHAQGGAAADNRSEAAKQLEGNILETVVVTAARKRTESVQVTPVAVTALNEETLSRVQATTLNDITKLAPNLRIIQIAGGGNREEVGIYLRGFGTSGNDPSTDPSIPLFVDGIYYPFMSGMAIDLFSVEGIEVLRGPQGTLYGKNAPTGAVSVRTKRPTFEWGGKVQLDYGRFNNVQARALVNIPIVQDKLAINISGIKKHMDNYYKDINTGMKEAGGEEAEAARMGILFTPNDRIDWYTTLTYIHDHSPPVALRSIPFPGVALPLQFPGVACAYAGYCNVTPDKFTFTTNPLLRNRPSTNTHFDQSSNLAIDLGPLTLTSVTGHKRYFLDRYQDFSRVPVSIGSDLDDRLGMNQFTQELRISSNKGGPLTLNDHLDWVFGGYYGRLAFSQRQQIFAYQSLLPLLFGNPLIPADWGVNAPFAQSQKTISTAWFGHVIANVTNFWNLSFGFRHSTDKKTHTTFDVDPADPALYGPFAPNLQLPTTFTLSDKWSNMSYEAGTQVKFSEDKMVYFRFAQGYRSGGIQGNATPAKLAGLPYPLTFEPETVNSYEVGLKADWLGKTLRTNISLFKNDYQNLQRNLAVFPNGNVVQLYLNAAQATAKGVEVELTYVPVPPLTLHTNIGYLNFKYKSYTGFLATGAYPPGYTYDESTNVDTQTPPFAPRWTLNSGFDYTHDWGERGVTVFSMAYDWRSGFNLNDQTIPMAFQKHYGLLDASIKWEHASGNYSVTFYGHNILNKDYLAYLVPALGHIGTDGLPVTWGLQLSANF